MSLSRDLFGAWGTGLTPADFSAALAGLAAFGPMTVLPPADQIKVNADANRDRSGLIVEVWLADIASGIWLTKAGRQLMSASDYALLWRNFSKHLAPAEYICIELDASRRDDFRSDVPDIFWVLRELARPGGAAGSAYLCNEQTQFPVAFEIPWRFGVLDDSDSSRIAEILDGSNWRHLYEIVGPGAPDLQCDMLILPFDLRLATSRLLAESRSIEADCVIVMRGIGAADTGQALALASAVERNVRTGGLVIAPVVADRDAAWLNELILMLAHNTPLVSALPRVQQAVMKIAAGDDAAENLPLIIASRRLAQAARVSEFASRLERATRQVATSVGPSLKVEADRLASYVKEGKWQAESGEATRVVETRRRIENAVGKQFRVPRSGETMAYSVQHAKPVKMSQTMPPPQKAASVDQRRVVLDLYDVTEPTSRPKVERRLLPNRHYELELFIAAARQGTVVAPERFPSNTLPPGESLLSVHFVPLVHGEDGAVLPSQHKPFKLPETADSGACTFRFDVPPTIETYRARLIISYRNRVLQTLILSAPVGDVAGTFLLDIENVVDPSFEMLSMHPPFDAAILVNDSPSGTPGLTTLQGSEAVFTEPAGLDLMTKDLRDFILEKAAYPASKRKYESKDTRELIYGLSRKGKGLWDELPQAAHDLLKDVTTRVQIVDMRNGAYFPAEFVYRGRSPKKDAKLCPNGATALQSPLGMNQAGGASHETCEHRDDPDFICPLRMWGFGIVIERQPATGAPQSGFILRDMTRLQGKTREGMFDRVVVSVSAKVSQADRNAVKNLVKALGKVATKVSVAKDWTALAATVLDESPTLLVLLPHSGVDEEDSTIPALELGGEWLSRDRLEPENIFGPKSDEPVLLLLGCDTDMAEIPFLNFIKRFKDCGAAMVMGTITQIEALRTVDFVERFAAAAAASNTGSTTFGELLLQTRRSMLASGDGYALSLLAYGDSDQRTA